MSIDVKALGFDVFGTVVDWRSSITREGEAFGRAHKLSVDWLAFAVAWRGLYQPMMDKVRKGEIGWTKLDDLHRMALDQLFKDFGIHGIPEADIDHLNRAWHRLDPWPDSVPGLTRLKTKYTIVTLSNGNVALMVNMAKRAGLPWDTILGAEPTKHYKPHPQAYLGTAELLGIEPQELMLCAAHNNDLKAAQNVGLRTAFIPRPTEHGPGQTKDLAPDGAWDIVAKDFTDLAAQMGC
jgi:2-haloacid dehalogenase